MLGKFKFSRHQVVIQSDTRIKPAEHAHKKVGTTVRPLYVIPLC
jgi:hypothetical protein